MLDLPFFLPASPTGFCSFSFTRRVFSRNRKDVTTVSWISAARGVRTRVAGVHVTLESTRVGESDGVETVGSVVAGDGFVYILRERLKRAITVV